MNAKWKARLARGCIVWTFSQNRHFRSSCTGYTFSPEKKGFLTKCSYTVPCRRRGADGRLPPLGQAPNKVASRSAYQLGIPGVWYLTAWWKAHVYHGTCSIPLIWLVSDIRASVHNIDYSVSFNGTTLDFLWNPWQDDFPDPGHKHVYYGTRRRREVLRYLSTMGYLVVVHASAHVWLCQPR